MEIEKGKHDFKYAVDKIIDSIKSGQEEMFYIYDSIENDCESMELEIEDIKVIIVNILDEIDELESEEKKSRQSLVNVNKKFTSQIMMEKAYNYANEIQKKLVLKRQEEKGLILKRNELQIRLRRSKELLEKGQNYMFKMNSVMDFLTGDLESVTKKVISLEDKASIGMKIIKNQEEERRRIVRDIHDGPAQNIASLIIKSEIIKRYIDKDKFDLSKEELTGMQSLLRFTLQDIRKVMYNLSPTSLDELGLVPTIERFVYDLRSRDNINIEFKVLNNCEIKNHLLKLTIFRIIQEALNNAIKHAKCRLIKVKLDVTLKKIHLIVQDNGIGFDINDLDKKKDSLGIGFMNERAQLLHGDLKIESTIGKGTKVTCVFLHREG